MSPTVTDASPVSLDAMSITDDSQLRVGPESLPDILAALNEQGIIDLSVPMRKAIRDLDVERYGPEMVLCANHNYAIVVRPENPS
jgi:hypothetical protein